MSIKTTALLKNLSRNWFVLFFLVILLVVLFISFFKIFELKDFLVKFPENCEVNSNTCVEVEGELIPSRFLLLKESYFLKNCEDENFNECIKKCEVDGMCTIEINNNE